MSFKYEEYFIEDDMFSRPLYFYNAALFIPTSLCISMAQNLLKLKNENTVLPFPRSVCLITAFS